MKKAIFEDLVYDTQSRLLPVVFVGTEPTYVYDDDGFERHIPAEVVDQQVWDQLSAGIEGNEDFLAEQTAKMLGQEDIFSMAVIRSQFQNRDKQFAELQQQGFPQDVRMYLGMVGFQIVVNHRGEVIELKQPAVTGGDDE
ncbi:MAG: hypothetical protein GX797_00080 [Chloroflexi bacterium]|nr:hypothetical protein [Chloroflexota bacterium]